jgi:hypothetical protein
MFFCLGAADRNKSGKSLKIMHDVCVSLPIGGPLLVAPLVLVQTMLKNGKSVSILKKICSSVSCTNNA